MFCLPRPRSASPPTLLERLPVKPYFDDLVQFDDATFCPDISHAHALFGRSADPDLLFSAAGLRRLGRARPAVSLSNLESLAAVGMRTSFGRESLVRVEVFHERPGQGGRRGPAASIRSGRIAGRPAPAALADPSTSSLTEHVISYLVRNDQLRHAVPRRDADLAGWVDGLHRATHYVSDMRRRPDRLSLDDGFVPVLRLDDPLGRWAAAAFELDDARVTIAGEPTFLDRQFVSGRSRSVPR